jgi:nitrate reductase gamma subunit
MKRELDTRAATYASVATLILLVAIYVGSGELRHLDPALVAYTSATIFATFGIVYRYSIWLTKPPTAMYFRRGWQYFLRPADLPKNIVMLVKLLWQNFVLQKFIERRSHLRWEAHFLISWGCIVACLITFPLVFGWIDFEASPHDPMAYQSFVFGIHAGTFAATSPIGWIVFHLLDFCAIAIIIGMSFAFRRRMHDPGAITTQSFSHDFLPLILLFTICVTGLMLTVSSLWMHGQSYSFISLLHAFAVIVTLLYMPFGKLFHVVQRTASLGVQYYKHEGAETGLAHCLSCHQPYTSRLHVSDLKTVLDQLGIDQRMPNGVHYQDICPQCRHRMLALNQREAIGGPGFI